METTHEITEAQRPFLAGFWLMAAIPISMLIALPLLLLLSISSRAMFASWFSFFDGRPTKPVRRFFSNGCSPSCR